MTARTELRTLIRSIYDRVTAQQLSVHGKKEVINRRFPAIAMEHTTLTLKVRENTGSKTSQKLRKNGDLPVVIYGNDAYTRKNVLASISKRQVDKMLRLFGGAAENTLFKVELDGEIVPGYVSPRTFTYDPVSDVPTNLNFLRFEAGKRKLDFPIVFFNEENSPGLKRGGYINYITHTIPCLALSEHIPRTLVIDVSGYEVGKRIRLENIAIPDSVQPLIPEKEIVATIAGKRGMQSGEEEEEDA